MRGPFPRPKPPTPPPSAGSSKDKTDPLPRPPSQDPRKGLPLDQQRQLVAPGEFIRLRLVDLRTRPTVIVTFPSGADLDVPFDDMPFLLSRYGLDGREATSFLQYLTNFKITAYWPNEKIHRIRLHTPDGSIRYV